MMSDPNLVTNYNFNGREYFIKMNASNGILELSVTDKQTGEDWQCCYEASYIESITQKTGNFKQFNIFVTMLKSGLLKTSNCLYLDLMTFDDLDALRNHRIRRPYSSYHMAHKNSNRRYLILTYTVEFDRIHYPLPLEYCGPPDPRILQQNIVKLEEEIVQLKQKLKQPIKTKLDTRMITSLEKQIEDLTLENQELYEEIEKLSANQGKLKNKHYISTLENAIKNLEKSVLSERKSHHKLVAKLRKEKEDLKTEVERLRQSERTLRVHQTPILSNISPRSPIRQRSKIRTDKRISNTGVNREYRSPSPKLYRSGSWEANLRENRPVTAEPKLRSNCTRYHKSSGSESDRSNSNKANKFKSVTMASGDKKYQSRNSSKKKMIEQQSRSSSTSSRCSYTSSNKNRNKTPPLVVQCSSSNKHFVSRRSSELDFSTLEERIQALQRMLHKDLVIR